MGVADSRQTVVLAGLHTCGDLSATMLRMFTSSSQVVGLVNVGCCYMKLTCATSSEPHPSTPIGYPLSKVVMSLDGHYLSYEARELACHALELYRDRALSKLLTLHLLKAFRAQQVQLHLSVVSVQLDTTDSVELSFCSFVRWVRILEDTLP